MTTADSQRARAREALKAVSAACAAAGRAVQAYRLNPGGRPDRRAEFVLLHARLVELAQAIGEVPESLTMLAPETPWRELQRLPLLLARPDIRHDPKILDVTLSKELRWVRLRAQAINMHLSNHPEQPI